MCILTTSFAAVLQSKEECAVPLTINCWPSRSGADSYVNIEYESSAPFDLQNVTIAIPLPHLRHAPTVNQVGAAAGAAAGEPGGGLLMHVVRLHWWLS